MELGHIAGIQLEGTDSAAAGNVKPKSKEACKKQHLQVPAS